MDKETEPKQVQKLRKILTKDVYTPLDLVRMGIYGSKSSVYRAIRTGDIESVAISDRRSVIFKESILNNVSLRMKKGRKNGLDK